MKRLLLILLVSLVVISAPAQDTIDTIQQPARPKVGLVLAGGGARGASFIGVLKYLEELDIPIDYVIGTSMGSIIGGVYAMGYSPDEMAKIITSMSWSSYIGNSLERSLLCTELRNRHSTQFVNIPFNAEGIIREGFITSFFGELPSAYVSNNDVDNLFNTLSQGYQDSISFDDLPIPYACIATDIVSGEEVVLRSGNLAKSIRASMAFPLIFSPVVIDGKLLYDGGLVNIFPSDVLRDMGADIIIGIEFTNEKFYIGDKIPSIAKLVDYIYNFAIRVKREENKKLCDLIIKPNTSEFGPLTFTPKAIDTLIVRGYEAAQKHHEPLARIKKQIDSIAGHPVGKELHAPKARGLDNDRVFVSSITLKGPTERQAKWLKREGKLHENQLITTSNINRAIKRFRGTGAFDAISYQLTPTDTTLSNYALSFRLPPKSPDIFGFGARYDTEEGAALLFSLGFNEKRLSGFKLKLAGRLSFHPRINATATYSLFPIVNFNLAYEYRNQLMKVRIPEIDPLDLRLQKHEIKGFLSQYQILNLNTEIGFSLTSTDFTQKSTTDFTIDTASVPMMPAAVFDNKIIAGPYLNIGYDNLDHSYFARRGIKTNVTGRYCFDIRNVNHTLQDFGLSFQGYLTPWQGKLTIIPQLYGHYILSNMDNASQWNLMGGEVAGRYTESHMPFVGINHVLTTSNLTTVLRCDLRYTLFKNNYLTGIYNYALCLDSPALLLNDEVGTQYLGFGLRYSYNSIIGPVSLTVHYSDYTKGVGAYFSLGFIF